MDRPEIALHQMIGDITGKQVRFVRLVTNSLLIYIECEPPAEAGFTLWFEPTWHIGCDRGVLLGSRQAQVEDNESLAKLSDLAGQLIGRVVERIEIDPLSHDMNVRFSDGYWAKTFVSDPTDDHSWDISDNAQRLVLEASPTTFARRERH
jgi:hypothetical protein